MAEINPIRYRGYYYDDEIDMYYLQSRYYNQSVGRFINSDDVDVLPNKTNQEKSILSYNLYTCCENDTVNSIDDNGKKNKKTKTFKYKRNKAFEYMKKWWNVSDKKIKLFGKKIVLWHSGNNNNYKYFYSDCTNFVSQCLHAGGLPMLKSWYSKWHWVGSMNGYSWKEYSYSRSWSVVKDNKETIGKHFTSKKYKVDSYNSLKGILGRISIGDVIYFKKKKKKDFSHAAIISSIDYKIKMVTYAQHTKSYLYRQLNSTRFKDYTVEIYHIKSKITINKKTLY